MAGELAGQMTLFDLAAPVRRKAGRPKLTVAESVSLYRSGMSACEIARDYKLTRSGVETRIRAGGLAGLAWCPVHRIHEEIHSDFRALGIDPGMVRAEAGAARGSV